MTSRDFPRLSARVCIVAVTAALAVASIPLQAQGLPGRGWGGDGGGYRGRGPGGSAMGGPHRRGRLPSPEMVEGPPAPPALRQIAGMSDEQTERYRKQYDMHMAATKPIRDSLRTTMDSMRAAFGNDDRSYARERHRLVERQWKTLSSRDDKFAKGLKNILDKDQMKRFNKWKGEREQDQRRRFDSGRGRQPPFDGQGRSAP